MDYLLRDSHHVGVAYGKFDHYRLIDTLRILPTPPSGEEESRQEPTLGVDEGGIQSAEALILARYFMFSQVYLHPIRRIYDIHLKDFLKEWLSGGVFSTDLNDHERITDNEVTAALLEAAFDSKRPGHLHARRIVCREHFKVLYERNPGDVKLNPEAGEPLVKALQEEFGPENFRRDRYLQGSGLPDFPVRLRDGQVVSSFAISDTLNNVPSVSVDYVFAERSVLAQAREWLNKNRTEVITPKGEQENG
jgi:HD superfamily phosphohydrolase